jgi:regulatory protein
MAPTLEEALGRAYGYLGKRDRTIAEVRAYLERAEATPELIDAAVGEIVELGYLDDERYSRCFAEDRRKLDGWGAERIRRRLLELGIDRELAEMASQPIDDEQEMTAALALLRRRLKTPPKDQRERQRALELLVRRGYEPDVAYEAVRRLRDQAAEAL